MTRIGEPKRTVIKEHPMIPARRRRSIPYPIKEPEKVPVRVTPSEEPSKEVWNSIGMDIAEIQYSCPKCGRELNVDEGILYCPDHGVLSVD